MGFPFETFRIDRMMDIVKDSCFSHLKRHSRFIKHSSIRGTFTISAFTEVKPAVLISSIPRLHAGIRLPIAFIRSHYVERRRDRDDELHPVKPVHLHILPGNALYFFFIFVSTDLDFFVLFFSFYHNSENAETAYLF